MAMNGVERVRSRLTLWGPLIFLELLGLVIRLGYMPGTGFVGDLVADLDWIKTMAQGGLFSIYANQHQSLIYPPISMAAFHLTGILQRWLVPQFTTLNDPQFVFFIKIFPVLADLLLIGVLYRVLWRKRLLRWLIPGLLAVHPALVANSAWWGANDAIFTLIIVLALLALNQDHSTLAWVLFGLAILTKQQALLLAPVMVVLSLRRYGMRRMALDLAVFILVVGLILLPFLVASGFTATLSPLTLSSNNYPGASVNALNFWYLAAPLSRGIVLKNWPDWPDVAIYPDYVPMVGPLSLKLLGYGLCGLFVLLLCISMWRNYEKRREFVWAAALYFGTFMLLTQMHERYLYAGAVLAWIAVIQERRLVLPAFLALFALAFNQFIVAIPLRWLGLTFWLKSLQTWVALLNMALLFWLTFLSVSMYPDSGQKALTAWPTNAVRSLVIGFRGLAAVLVIGIFVALASANIFNLQTANWMVAHIADYEHVAVDQQAEMTMSFARDSVTGNSWVPTYSQVSIEEKPVSTWYDRETHYLLVDEKNTGMERNDFEQRISKLTDQGATLLFKSPGVPHLVPRQAVMWTFKAQHPLDLTFDDHLRLTGYDVSRDDRGDYHFLLYWYTAVPGAAAYQLFVHLIDSNTGNLISQADRPLGQSGHPSDAWRRGEIVFDPVTLPGTDLADLTNEYHVEIGLYQLSSGTRAQIKDGSQHPLGDSYPIEVP